MSSTIYFDLETGGIEPTRPSIQLAAVAIDDRTGRELSCFECKLAFLEADADPEALKLNHYSKESWEGAISPMAAAGKFARFAEPYRSVQMISKRTGAPYSVSKLAGYNALTFDGPRLRELYGNAFFPFSYHIRDVLQRSLFWFDEHPEVKKPENLKLGTVCAFFGISIDNAHDALADVRMTVALARRLACADLP